MLAAVVNACVIALMDAGISIERSVVAISCMYDDEGRLTMEPTLRQQQNATSLITFGLTPNSDDTLLLSHTSGACSSQQYFTALSAARDASKQLYNLQTLIFQHKYSKQS